MREFIKNLGRYKKHFIDGFISNGTGYVIFSDLTDMQIYALNILIERITAFEIYAIKREKNNVIFYFDINLLKGIKTFSL